MRRGVRHMVVGTANAGIGPLAFHQGVGFRFWKVERDFFGPARGYPEAMEEDGIPVRDMVWMDQEIKRSSAALVVGILGRLAGTQRFRPCGPLVRVSRLHP
jgi:hypothetical protein